MLKTPEKQMTGYLRCPVTGDGNAAISLTFSLNSTYGAATTIKGFAVSDDWKHF